MAILGALLSPSQHCIVLVLRENPFDTLPRCMRLLAIIDFAHWIGLGDRRDPLAKICDQVEKPGCV
jgi:hypothetical protein